ncbi:MAG TPA: cation:proton antiporter [Geminicoccaceae bacterium]
MGSRGEQALSEIQFVALILALIGPLLALAKLLNVSETFVLFGTGVAMAFVPGLPPLELDPKLVFAMFLSPLLYAGTSRVTVHLLSHTLVPGVLLGVALVLATIAGVAVASRLLLPGLPWTGAILLGCAASAFETRLFHEAEGRPKVPRGVADTLKSWEIVSRAVILTCFALGLQAASGGSPPSAGAVFWKVFLDTAVAAAVGAAVGWAFLRLRDRVDPAPIEIAVSVAIPYAAGLIAEALGANVVVLIAAAALVISATRIDPRTGEARTSSEARVTGVAFWEQASLMISSLLYLLIGRALPDAVRALGERPVLQVAACVVALLAVLVAIKYAAALAATALPPAAGTLRRRGAAARLAAAGVMSWACTRSPIGLVIALSIPATLPDGRPFPDRDLILVVTALLVVGSTLVQGLTLRFAVQGAELGGEDEEEREVEEAERAMEAARPRAASNHEEELAAERKALLELRERDRIGDEVLDEKMRRTDLRERVMEESAMPGAGPPNP